MNSFPTDVIGLDEDARGLDSRRPSPSVLLAAFRFWPLLLLLALGFGIIGVYQAVSRDEEFTSDAKILVRIGLREQAPLEAEVVSDSGGAAPGREGAALHDLIQIFGSPATFRQVVEKLGSAAILAPSNRSGDDPGFAARIRAVFDRWIPGLSGAEDENDGEHGHNCGCEDCVSLAAESLSKSTKIAPEQGSRVIRISHTAESPERAQMVAEAILDVCQQQHREVFGKHPSFEFLKGSRDDSIEAVSLVERQLLALRQQYEVYDINRQQDSLVEEIHSLTLEKGQAERRLAEAKARSASLKARLESEPEMLSEVRLTSTENPQHRFTWDQLGILWAKREEMLVTQAADSPQIKALDLRLEELEKAVAELPVFVTAESQVPNPRKERLRVSYEQAEDELAALEASVTEFGHTFDSRRKRLEEFRLFAPEVLELEDKLERSKATASKLNSAFEEMTVRNALYLADLGNLRVIQQATFPRDSGATSRFLMTLTYTAIGLFLGWGLAVILSLLDRRIRVPENLESSLRVRVVGVTPHVRPLSRHRSAPRRKVASSR